ncbi:SCO2400 family protein [Streptomyces sp. DT195]|uniref:SCO2400 family protein n=1 Tax=Streptomyces sp. DT195 TaxID=3393419 RepID=UPI003CFABA10
MDYCSACRRHLNGALVCPGCGDCASPDLAPMPVRPSTYAVRRPGEEDAAPSRHGRSAPPPIAPRPHRPAEVATGSGRAARRREQTRWRKTRRRAVLAAAFTLVGGGLTFAALNHQPTDRTRPTAAQAERPMGGTGPEATAGLPVPTRSPAHGSATPSSPPSTGGGKSTAPSAPRATTPTAPRTASPEPSEPSRSASHSALPHARSLLPLPHSAAPDSATPSSPLAPTEQSPTTPAGSTPAPTPDTTTDSPSASPSTPPASQPPSSAPASPSQSASRSASPSAAPSASPSRLCLLVVCLG